MAGYPGQPPYGVNYGDEQTNNQYQPPYSNPYMQPNASAQSHMGANYNAYGYNNAPVAPFPTPSVAPGVPPLPLFQGWNQDPIPLPPFTTPQNSTPYQTYNQSTQNQAGQQYYSAASQPGYAPTRTAHQSHDRDFSEGEFEGSAPSHTPVNYTASQWGGNGRNGYVDTAQRAVYNKPQEYNSQPPTHSGNYKPHSRDNSQKRGRQSGSHSPYVSSGGGDREESKGASQKKSYNRAQPSVDRPKSQVGLPRTIPTPHRANGFHTSGQDAKAEQELQPAQSDISSASGIPANANGKSHLEMKKKAQNAILTLWPRDHRYQALLDAGMKEDIVSSLYDDLKLSKTSNAANSESDRPTPNATNIPSSTEPSASKGTPMPNGASAPVIAVSAPRSTAMDEKQKTLQSKMEALRKSREQRAQKAALGTSSKTAATPTAVAGVKRAEPTAIIVEAPKSPQQSTYALASQIPKEAVTANATPSESQAPPPPAPVNNAPQVSAIPGLFLVSNPPPPAPTASLAPPAGVVSQRKRPVATDFDDPTPPVAFKRPFGHNRHEKPLIIDVSDEESDDEDVAMELDSQAGSPDQPPPKMSDQRTRPAPLAQQHSNSSPDFHTRPQSTIQPGAVEVLKKKENEIEALKRLIAEREAQKRSKARNTPNSSGQQTPRASEVQSTAINGAAGPTNGDLTRNAELSMQIQDKMEVADQKVAIDSQKLAEVQAAEAEKAEELSKKEAEEKRLRRQKIASDLPMVAAEVQQQKSRLEEMRAEMAKIEADMQKKLEGQKILAEEMERLGQETEDQLQAHKDKLEELNQAEAKDVGSSRLSSSSVDDSSIKHEGGERQLSNVIATTISTADDHSINAEPTLPPIEQPIQNTNGTLSNAMEEDNDHYKDSLSTDQALEAQLQNSIQAEADSHAHDEMEIEQVYAPDPRQLGPEMASSPPEEGQISEDEYSPVLDRAMPDVPDHESDGYEPPDATDPDENDAMDSPPFSPAPPIPVPNLNDDELRVINPTQVADLSGRSGVEDTPAFEHGGVLHEVEVVAKTGGPQFFTPYESPLKIFHAYRFHPLFKQSVAGGLRSLTYSNKINANIELCPYETAGGICNDDTCHFQHFRSIKLPDDAIMAAIGSPEEFQGEQRENFTDSLREVLMGLRVRKIKDFATISSEIIAHRAKFLNDPSKTLAALEGVSL